MLLSWLHIPYTNSTLVILDKKDCGTCLCKSTCNIPHGWIRFARIDLPSHQPSLHILQPGSQLVAANSATWSSGRVARSPWGELANRRGAAAIFGNLGQNWWRR